MPANSERIMVQSQLLTNHVLDANLIAALEATPRASFLPEALKGVAHVDDDLEIAPGRYLIEPLAFARMLHLADIAPTDRVLVVGCLTGFSVAVIARLAAQVIGIEEQRDMAEKARQNLEALGITNAEIFTSALTAGYQVAAPFDVIVLEGAIRELPTAFVEQLAEGGRLVAVENIAARPGSTVGIGKALLVRKSDIGLEWQRSFDASVPLLPGFEPRKRFAF